MKLLFDQGNSRLKWALATEQGDLVRRGVMQEALVSDSDFTTVMGGMRKEDLTAVALSSVGADARREALVSCLRRVTGMEPCVAVARAACAGLQNGYTEPSRLGVDRWLAMLGARAQATGALLVVDAGTAMTIDAVRGDGRHLGGYIVPGYRMQLTMLDSQTASVGYSSAAPSQGWGRDTQQAVANGVAHSMAALVERALIELRAAVADTCRVVITGGDAELIAAQLSCAPLVDADLLFRGLMVDLRESGSPQAD